MAAIFDFSLIRTSDSLWGSLVSPDLENMGIAVGISLLSCIETELRLISFFSRHLGFLISGFIRQSLWWCHWTVYPRKHRGRHRNCVSITSDSWVTGGGNFTTLPRPPPPRSALQNSVRCPRVNLWCILIDFGHGCRSLIVNPLQLLKERYWRTEQTTLRQYNRALGRDSSSKNA